MNLSNTFDITRNSSDHLCNLYGPSVLMDPNIDHDKLLKSAVGVDDEDGEDFEDLGGGGGSADQRRPVRTLRPLLIDKRNYQYCTPFSPRTIPS